MSNDTIVSAAIYPPIGVCRVGNSPDKFYIGPEVPDPAPLPPETYRDDQGRLSREAARFRIYGLNSDGVAVKELLPCDDTQIVWQVDFENQKSSWYEFQLALDIPEAADAPPSKPRNASITDRAKLNITPGPRTIDGTGTQGPDHAFTGGAFMGTEVYLGELRTDDAGRLIVLGGHGVSASYTGDPATTFANNEGWHDDTADGPVTATVTHKGNTLNVDPAWCIVAPPNYGPQQKSVRTMWDLMRDTAVKAKMLTAPDRPSFQNDIRPIFERLSDLQWVNQGFFAGFGQDAPFEFSTEDWLHRLNDASDGNTETRRVLANTFRHFDIDGKSPVPWPWLYGDAMNIPPANTPRQNAALSDLQLDMLEQWATGDFDADYDPAATSPQAVEEVPVADQPDLLTRAAMDFCLADAFHPGCEMTWPMRQTDMYMAPYRVKHRDGAEPNFGPVLTPAIALSADGPIGGGQTPGSITRWMAIPWQTDTSSCRSGYVPAYDPYVPTFWPARVPNEVLSEEAYQVVTDTTQPMQARLEAFRNRANWLEPLGLDQSYIHQINHMIHHFDQMGVVAVRPGLPDEPEFPDVFEVSDQQEVDTGVSALATGPDAARHTDLTSIDKVRRLAGTKHVED